MVPVRRCSIPTGHPWLGGVPVPTPTGLHRERRRGLGGCAGRAGALWHPAQQWGCAPQRQGDEALSERVIPTPPQPPHRGVEPRPHRLSSGCARSGPPLSLCPTGPPAGLPLASPTHSSRRAAGRDPPRRQLSRHDIGHPNLLSSTAAPRDAKTLGPCRPAPQVRELNKAPAGAAPVAWVGGRPLTLGFADPAATGASPPGDISRLSRTAPAGNRSSKSHCCLAAGWPVLPAAGGCSQTSPPASLPLA